MRRHVALVLFPLLAVLCLISFPSQAGATWHTYFGPSLTIYANPNDATKITPGWAYRNNDRVYRPWNDPNNRFYFFLGYQHQDGSIVWSQQNWDSDPFEFPGSYGYTRALCQWNYQLTGQPYVYPVTCQSNY
jgi:hypothetical protein